jgi:hypothetical protein
MGEKCTDWYKYNFELGMIEDQRTEWLFLWQLPITSDNAQTDTSTGNI